MTITTTCRGAIPSAFRTAISRVRCRVSSRTVSKTPPSEMTTSTIPMKVMTDRKSAKLVVDATC